MSPLAAMPLKPSSHPFPALLAHAAAERVSCGTILEVGPGRLFPGLSLLGGLPDLELVGLGYSSAEAEAARVQAGKLGLTRRIEYRAEGQDRLPLEDQSVEAAIAFGAARHWARPLSTLEEFLRVLKRGGRLWIGDFRRDQGWLSAWWTGLWHDSLRSVWQQRHVAWSAQELGDCLRFAGIDRFDLIQQGHEVWVTAEKPL